MLEGPTLRLGTLIAKPVLGSFSPFNAGSLGGSKPVAQSAHVSRTDAMMLRANCEKNWYVRVIISEQVIAPGKKVNIFKYKHFKYEISKLVFEKIETIKKNAGKRAFYWRSSCTSFTWNRLLSGSKSALKEGAFKFSFLNYNLDYICLLAFHSSTNFVV